MAVFIYHEYYDGSGEGTRAELNAYEFQQQAHDEMLKLRGDDQVLSAKVIVGTVVEEFNADDVVDDVQISG